MVYHYIFKILILGDCRVGKSSIHHILEKGYFIDYMHPTIGIEFMTKYIHINDAIIKCQLWDASGDQRFYEIIDTYIKDNIGIILVFDKSNYDSFINLEKWIKKIKKLNYNEMPNILLVGNKCDKKIKISTETAEEFAEKNNFDYVELSAKRDNRITMAFVNFIKKIYNRGDSIDYLPGVKLGVRRVLNLKKKDESVCERVYNYFKC